MKSAAAQIGLPQQPQSGVTPLNAVKPLPAINVTGQPRGGSQPKPPQPNQPNFQGMQPQNNAWRPSAVAPIAAGKGNPAQAWTMNLFKPPQQPQQGQLPMKQANVLTNLFLKTIHQSRPLIMGIKFADTEGPRTALQVPEAPRPFPPGQSPDELGWNAPVPPTNGLREMPRRSLVRPIGPPPGPPSLDPTPTPTPDPMPPAPTPTPTPDPLPPLPPLPPAQGSSPQQPQQPGYRVESGGGWNVIPPVGGWGHSSNMPAYQGIPKATMRPMPGVHAPHPAAPHPAPRPAPRPAPHPMARPKMGAAALGKAAAAVATGDALPKDWNGKMTMPDKVNGGIGSHGKDAWESVNHFKHPKSDKMNLEKDWHIGK